MEEGLNPTLFYKFNKIPRLNREMIVTEKIDGTNAQIYIEWMHAFEDYMDIPDIRLFVEQYAFMGDGYYILVGSRKRWIYPGDDNFGFAKWVGENLEQLLALGPGRHFGEWWGKGIQRNYGLPIRRFSLFNVTKWSAERPRCCDVVPVLYQGMFNQDIIELAISDLKVNGSKAAPGYMKPEGVVVFHTAANKPFKVTCEKDESPKGAR